MKSSPLPFSNRDLFRLFLPVVVEQFLEYLVGLADSIMVTHVGEAAVSGVSLVDFLMALLISVFAALATGGAVVAGQYLGRKQPEEANKAVNQLVWATFLLSLLFMAAVYLAKGAILHGLFGRISTEVYGHANAYLLLVAASIPSIALYGAGAALFRSMGDSRLPMRIMIAMNGLHVAANAILIYGFRLGTAGAGISTLISRTGAALIILLYASGGGKALRLESPLRYRPDRRMLADILRIGVPYGFENGMFYLGRLVILSLVASFGTASIAANSVAGTLVMFEVLPGMAMGLGMTVVISRCAGAGDFSLVRRYTRKIVAAVYAAHLASSALVLALLPALLGLYRLSPEASAMTAKLVWAHALMMAVWPLAYTLPVTFRASGDARFPMAVSVLSMAFCRVALAYLFSLGLGLGMFGTWAAMFVDWAAKAAVFVWRYLSGRWTKARAIDRRSGARLPT